MRRCRFLVLSLVLGASCTDPPEEAVIALATGISGAPSVAVAQARADGQGGIPLRFIYDTLDRTPDPESELGRTLEFLREENLVGFVGPAGSRAALVVAPVLNEAEIVQVVPTGTSRKLAEAGPWTFTLAPNDSVEGAAIGSFVADSLEADRATVFYLTDEYGYGLRDGVVASLAEKGVEVLDAVPLTPRYQMAGAEEADLESIAEAALLKGDPDVVVLAVRDYTTRFLVPYLSGMVPGVVFVAGDGALLEGQNRIAAEPYLDRIYQTVFWLPDPQDPRSREFIREYEAVAGVPPGHDHALYVDGMQLLAGAVREVGPDPEDMRQYLLSLGREREPFPGITGPISFDTQRTHPVFIVRADRLPDR